MSRPSLSTRLQIAGKALVGLISDKSRQDAYGLLSGIYPATGPLPERGTMELLDGYRTMPWLRAVAYRVAHAVSTTPWVLYKPSGGQQERIIQRAYRGVERHRLLKQATDESRLVPVQDHILLDALHSANSFMVGPSLFFITQVHLDLPGDAFWIKERNGAGAPVGFWPIPPHWVRATPTVSRPYYQVQWKAWQGEIPDTEILWFTEPNPVDPYGRGSGLARALADELETDEYAAKHERATLLNRARPDLIIWPEETKTDAGQIDESTARRLAEKWRAEHQGFWRSALPYFATRKLGVKELSQSFKDLTLTDLRKQERDIIIQVWGVPPEQLGIIDNSNRATIDSSDYLMKRNVVQPRLDLLRAYLQERLIPEYDERLVIDYISPVQEDRDYQLAAAKEAPYTLMVDEWRALAGRPPLPDGKGQVHLVASNFQAESDISATTAKVASPLTTVGSPGGLPSPTGGDPNAVDPATPAPKKRAIVGDAHDLEVVAHACEEAGDSAALRLVQRTLSEDIEDMPALSQEVARRETSIRRLLTVRLSALQAGTSAADLQALLTQAVSSGTPPPDVTLAATLGMDEWVAATEEEARGWLAEAYLAGAKVGATQAGLSTKAPDPVFNVANPEAIAWANRYAASLVTGISGATVVGLRAAIETALDLGWSVEKLARVVRETVGLTQLQTQAVLNYAAQLMDSDAEYSEADLFGKVRRYAEAQRRVRSLTIARTELANAASAGQQRLWELAIQQGSLNKDRVQKKWIATWDEILEVRCRKLAEDPPVPVNQPFSNGLMGPPDHPNCRCAAGLVRVEKAVAEPLVRLVPTPVAQDWDAIVRESVRAGLAPLLPEPPRPM